jgi:hypothetical protein
VQPLILIENKILAQGTVSDSATQVFTATKKTHVDLVWFHNYSGSNIDIEVWLDKNGNSIANSNKVYRKTIKAGRAEPLPFCDARRRLTLEINGTISLRASSATSVSYLVNGTEETDNS